MPRPDPATADFYLDDHPPLADDDEQGKNYQLGLALIAGILMDEPIDIILRDEVSGGWWVWFRDD